MPNKVGKVRAYKSLSKANKVKTNLNMRERYLGSTYRWSVKRSGKSYKVV